MILKSGTTPSVWLFGTTAQGSGGGAPTNSKYVTTAADGGLSAEIVIPGLAGSADIAGAAGAGTSEEFDSGSDPFTWSPNDPATHDVNTTVLSHLFLKSTDTTDRFGTKAWSPAGDFDARWCMDVSLVAYSGTPDVGIAAHIANSDDSVRANLIYTVHTAATATKQVYAFTYASSTYTQRGATWTGFYACPKIYARIKRVSGTFSFYWSANGLIWNTIASQALTMTVAKIGLRFYGLATNTECYAIVDWLRTDV